MAKLRHSQHFWHVWPYSHIGTAPLQLPNYLPSHISSHFSNPCLGHRENLILSICRWEIWESEKLYDIGMITWVIEFWVINYKLCHLGKVPDGSINYHLSTIIRMILKFGNSPVMCRIASAHPPLPQRWWSPNSIPLWTWSYFKIGPLWMTKLEWSHQGRPQSILRMCRNEKDKFRHRDRRAQREDNVKTHENATYKPSNVWVYSS